MTPEAAVELAIMATMLAAKLVAPFMLTAVVVGVVTNIFQTVTSIRDQSLTFIPKMAACAVVLVLTMPWMIQTVTTYFNEIYGMFGAFG
jgi:flagellar biosynthesis protein FliQ